MSLYAEVRQCRVAVLYPTPAEKAGVGDISLYEGCKHSFATDAHARGVPERNLQAILGHADARSTRRYARLQGNALVEVLRPRDTAQPAADLSLTCPWPETGPAKTLISKGEVVEAAGIEPASRPL